MTTRSAQAHSESPDRPSTADRSRSTSTVPAVPGMPGMLAVFGIVAVLSLVLSSCGRSAPDGQAAAADQGDEPPMAGVLVASAEPVIDPAALPAATVPTVTTATTAAPVAAGTYVVEPGDTLSVIAERFGVSVAALSSANGITDVDTIRPGQELVIPG